MEQIEKLKKELAESQALWSKYSCDCLAHSLNTLEKQIKELVDKSQAESISK